MRRSESQSIKSALSEFLKKNRLEKKWNEYEVIQKWNALLGPMVANRTTDVVVRNMVLYVTLNSSALRQELLMSKSKIVESLNQEMEQEVIKNIVFK